MELLFGFVGGYSRRSSNQVFLNYANAINRNRSYDKKNSLALSKNNKPKDLFLEFLLDNCNKILVSYPSLMREGRIFNIFFISRILST